MCIWLLRLYLLVCECMCFFLVYVFACLYRIYQLHFAGECLMCIVAVTTYRADTLDLASVSFQPAMRIVTMVPLLFLPKNIQSHYLHNYCFCRIIFKVIDINRAILFFKTLPFISIRLISTSTSFRWWWQWLLPPLVTHLRWTKDVDRKGIFRW